MSSGSFEEGGPGVVLLKRGCPGEAAEIGAAMVGARRTLPVTRRLAICVLTGILTEYWDEVWCGRVPV